MSRSVLLAATLGTLGFAAPGAVFADEPPREGPQAMWQKLDKDSDGRVSRAEADGAPHGKLASRFDAIDGNKDGFLTQDEFRAAHGKKREQRGAQMQERLKEADINGDGQISLDEAQAKLPRLAPRFNDLDADKNGMLSAEELAKARRGGSAR
jgi:Ca2+-binding EF-hand superfamily protein